MSCKYTSAHDRAFRIVKPAVDRMNATSKYIKADYIDFPPSTRADHFSITADVYIKDQVGRVQRVKKNFGWELKFYNSTKGDLVIDVGTFQEDYYPSRLAQYVFGDDEDTFIKEIDRIMNSFVEKELFEITVKKINVEFSMETPSKRRSKQRILIEEY